MRIYESRTYRKISGNFVVIRYDNVDSELRCIGNLFLRCNSVVNGYDKRRSVFFCLVNRLDRYPVSARPVGKHEFAVNVKLIMKKII